MEAATSLKDRSQKLEDVAERIEKGMELIGATAIEDKLQVSHLGCDSCSCDAVSCISHPYCTHYRCKIIVIIVFCFPVHVAMNMHCR